MLNTPYLDNRVMFSENSELDQLQRRLDDAHQSSAMLRDVITQLESKVTRVDQIDMARLAKQSVYGTVRVTIGCNQRSWQVTYYDDQHEKHDIRGCCKQIADHINHLADVQ